MKLGVLLGAAVAGGAVLGILPHLIRDEYEGEITEKNIKRVDSGEDATDKYLVWMKLRSGEMRVFENTDSLLEWKWNSADVYGQVRVGCSYRLETYGWRWPFFSSFENIVGVNPVGGCNRQPTEKSN